jgi:hypothetical protein
LDFFSSTLICSQLRRTASESVALRHVAKDVGVAADELGVEVFGDVAEVEVAAASEAIWA